MLGHVHVDIVHVGLVFFFDSWRLPCATGWCCWFLSCQCPSAANTKDMLMGWCLQAFTHHTQGTHQWESNLKPCPNMSKLAAHVMIEVWWLPQNILVMIEVC
jgi:hypothetical protein